MLLNSLPILVSIFSGALLGYIFGFAIAGHNDAVDGVRPRNNNQLIFLLMQPPARLSFVGKVIFILCMLIWLPLLFCIGSLPAIVGTRLGIEDMSVIKTSYLVFIAVAVLFLRLGKKSWKAMV